MEKEVLLSRQMELEEKLADLDTMGADILVVRDYLLGLLIWLVGVGIVVWLGFFLLFSRLEYAVEPAARLSGYLMILYAVAVSEKSRDDAYQKLSERIKTRRREYRIALEQIRIQIRRSEDARAV